MTTGPAAAGLYVEGYAIFGGEAVDGVAGALVAG
jgi:hypothetical protein